jgi:predicted metal-dependent TIM-barrel fold hydrolase
VAAFLDRVERHGASDVVALIPEFLAWPNVFGIGEIGLSRNTRNELKVLE